MVLKKVGLAIFRVPVADCNNHCFFSFKINFVVCGGKNIGNSKKSAIHHFVASLLSNGLRKVLLIRADILEVSI